MDKPTLLLLHGALGSSAQFKKLSEELDKNFKVHPYNFPGHGGENMPETFLLSQFSEELEKYIDKHDLQGCFVFGYSMGGYVALNLASKNLNLFEAIHTLGTKMSWSPEIAEREVKMLNPQKIEEKVPQFAQALAKRHQPNDWKEVLNKTAHFMTDLGNGSCLQPTDFEAIKTPVQIGIGAEDKMVSRAESKEVSEHLPQGSFITFEGFKHPIEQGDISVLAEALESYFNSFA